jgi:methyltransferase
MYLLFVAFAALLSLAERLYALRNERRLLGAGGAEIAPQVFSWMAPVYALHFAAAVAERSLLHRQVDPLWAGAMVALYVAAKILKGWAVWSLGPRWTMRVVIPKDPMVVTGGPYRFIRHPNYVAVMAEILALPLAGGAYFTAAIFGGAFLLILRARVRSEEEALLRLPQYASQMALRARFLPGGR